MTEQSNNSPANPRHLGIGTWISIGNPVITELASEFSFDWLLFDLEHGYLQESSLVSNFQAAGGKDIRLIVRAPSLNPALIARILDWGASGIMMPHVANAEQALACIKAMRYPPRGQRGYSGSARSFTFGLKGQQNQNKSAMPILMVQIENTEGVKNAEEIAGVEGVDVLFVGPSDLKLELDTNSNANAVSYKESLQIVCRAAQKYRKQAGILVHDPGSLEELIPYGFTCFAISSELGVIVKGYQGIISKTSELMNKLMFVL